MRRIPRALGLGPAPLAALLAGAGLCWSAAVPAHEPNFPVIEQVIFVLDCMNNSDGQPPETLYTCSCRMEYLDKRLSFVDYEEAKTYQRFKKMPGKRGGMFRDSETGEAKAEKLEQVLAEMSRVCPAVKRVRGKRPSREAREPHRN